MQVCASRLVVLTTKGEGKRRAASDCLCGIAYLAICAIIKTELADVARRLPRNFIVDRKYRLPSGRRYFCYLVTEMMMATKVPNAIIKDNVGGKMNLPPHGKEIFTNAVSSILHKTVRSFLHGTVNRILQITQ